MYNKKFIFLTKVFNKYIDINLVEEKWRQLPFFLTDVQKSNLRSLSIPEMWYEISKLKDFIDDQPKFVNISKLAQLVISLPHSNAEAERIFSMMNDIKTKKGTK